jgi:hypothetical protein
VDLYSLYTLYLYSLNIEDSLGIYLRITYNYKDRIKVSLDLYLLTLISKIAEINKISKIPRYYSLYIFSYKALFLL